MRKLKYKFLMLLASLTGLNKKVIRKSMKEPLTPIFTISFNDIHGKETSLAPLKGKKILIVNVASQCGFTPQYVELQELHDKHGDEVVIVAFPSNDFGGQEPGSNEEIANFCEVNFGVKFELTEKVKVTGSDKHPIYDWLTDPGKNGWNDQEPKWNFCKYLIDEQGRLTNFWASGVSPMDREVLKAITS